MIWESLRPCATRSRFSPRVPKLLLAAALAAGGTLCPSEGALAQVSELAADLVPGDDLRNLGSEPFDFHTLGDRVLFFTGDELEPGELWVTEGTPATTRSLARAAGPALGQAGGLLYFLVPPPEELAGASALWRTDGTSAGTVPLFASFRSSGFERPAVAALGENLLFATSDQLWRSDGTAEGTEPVALIGGVAEITSVSGGRALVLNESALWLTDGTPAGTRLLFSSLDGVIEQVTVSGSKIYLVTFEAFAEEPFRELRVLDSLDSATRFVELPPDVELQRSLMVPEEPGAVLFMMLNGSFDSEIWRTDGTPAGTRRLAQMPEGQSVRRLWYDGGKTWAWSRDFQTGTGALWRIDEGAGLPAEIFPDCEGPGCTEAEGPITRFGEHFLIQGPRGDSPHFLWISGGTPGDVRPLRDFCRPGCEATFSDTRIFGDQLFFLGQKTTSLSGLYQSDGSPAGTRVLTPMTLGLNGSLSGVAPLPGDRWVLGLGSQTTGIEPWVVSGEPSSAQLLQDIGRRPPGVELRDLVPSGGEPAFLSRFLDSEFGGNEQAYRLGAGGLAVRLTEFDRITVAALHRAAGVTYLTDSGAFHQLWALGDSLAETTVLAAFSSVPGDIVAYDGRAFFTVPFGDDIGLWETDGTTAGTRLVFSPPGPGITRLSDPVAGEDGLFFMTQNADGDSRLWRSDGKEAGSTELGSLGPNVTIFGTTGLQTPVSLDGSSYVLVCGGGSSQTLWRIGPGGEDFANVLAHDDRCPSGLGPSPLFLLGSRIAFFSVPSTPERSVRAFDPALGEAPLLALGEPPREVQAEAVLLGDQLLFPFEAEATGLELWITDGTQAGTGLLKDVSASFSSSDPRHLTAAGDVVYFAARTQAHGRELWVTDGTEAGTRLVHDVFPGAQGSSPEQLTVVGDKLYFTADDGLTGRELWVLPLDGGAPCRASDEALCLQGDRFRVEARWRNFRDEEGTGQAVELTQDTGYFWFFNEQNVEAVLKVLDGRTNNDHFWSFYGALSNVEYWLTVTDTETGLTRRYYNPLRNFASVGDTFSFGPQGASLRSSPDLLEASASPLPEVIQSQVALGSSGTCAPSSERLCVNGGRFAVEVTWQKPDGETGTGKAVDLTDDTGYFWFFRDTNVELILKVLDGTANNGHFWVFYGSLSNVDFDVTVTDTETGEVRTYLNRGREFASVGDTEAFIVP